MIIQPKRNMPIRTSSIEFHDKEFGFSKEVEFLSNPMFCNPVKMTFRNLEEVDSLINTLQTFKKEAEEQYEQGTEIGK